MKLKISMCAWFPLEPLLETWAPKRQSAPLPSWVFCQKREHRAATESLEERHGMFLVWSNITKSLSNIWQVFSCLLPKEIAKISIKLKSHDGLQGMIANQAHLLIFNPVLKKNYHRFYYIFGTFLQSRHQLDMKTNVKCWKYLFGIPPV